MVGPLLAAWPDETNRLPPQRPRSARPPGLRTHPHAGRGAVCRRPLPSSGCPAAGGGPAEHQPLARPLAGGWTERAGKPRSHRAGPAPVGRPARRHRPGAAPGARANGFDPDHWTLERITTVIQRLTGTRYHPGHTWKLLRRMGWRLQRPPRAAPWSVTSRPSPAGWPRTG